jgi:hypothetical protein
MSIKAYEEWLEAYEALQHTKSRELKLRNKIISDIGSDKLEGSITIRSPREDYKVTITTRVNRAVDRPTLEAIWDGLSADEQDCIDYKPNLVLAKYKPFEATGSKILEAITVKPGQASLKIDRVES